MKKIITNVYNATTTKNNKRILKVFDKEHFHIINFICDNTVPFQAFVDYEGKDLEFVFASPSTFSNFGDLVRVTYNGKVIYDAIP